MQNLTVKEEQIMQALWKAGHPCLISEILKSDPSLKRNTVAPGIIGLVNKGYVKVDSIGKSVTRTGRAYSAIISQEDYEIQQAMINSIIESPNTKKGALACVSSLLSTKQADESFLDEVDAMIREFKNQK